MQTTPGQLGLDPGADPSGVYGLMLDWPLMEVIISLVCVSSGDASKYTSTGGGMIGGGSHDAIKTTYESEIIYLVMKFLTIGFLFCCQLAFTQTDSVTYLKEIGWTIKIPSSFNEQLPILKLIPGDPMRRLVGVAKGRDAALWIKIDTANAFTNSNWEKKDESAIDLAFKIVERSAPYKFDTANYLVRYDGVQFKKRIGKETITRNEFWFTVSSRTLYKNHYFVINYTYKNEAAGNEIEQMLSTSKFDK